MRIPKSLTIYGKKTPIKKIKGLHEQGAIGLYRPKENIIYLDADLKGNELKITFIHEVLHALFNRVSINDIISLETEEMIVDNVAKMLVENFKIT